MMLSNDDRAGGSSRRPTSASGRRVSSAVRAAMVVAALAGCGAAQAEPKPSRIAMSPEVKLIDDYNAQVVGRVGAADVRKLKACLIPYITDKTVLHEPVSLPWGGTIIGYDGWVRLVRISDPVFAKLADRMVVSAPTYYQAGHVVLDERTITFKAKRSGEAPFVTQIIEKYTVDNGRISQIDEFWADTASLLRELTVFGALPPARP